jgi:nitrile hydratase subunit beta
MDGIHDLGGRQGFGPVVFDDHAQPFEQRWEAAVFAMTRAARACGALQNTDQFRHAVERIDPVAYLTHGYYGRWLGAVENLLVEAGVVTTQALNDRVRAAGGDPEFLVAARPDPKLGPIAPATAEGERRESQAPPQFVAGQWVRTASTTTSGHTRLPAYARNRRGRIRSHHDSWVLPDSNAHGRGEAPSHLYTVEFSAQELWGAEAETDVLVCLDLFEPYLSAINGDQSL